MPWTADMPPRPASDRSVSWRRRVAWWMLVAEALVRLAGLKLFLLAYGAERQPRLYGQASRPEVGAAANAAFDLGPEQERMARRIGKAIVRAEALLPFDVVCLPQALVGRRMLRNRGLPSVMFFGVEQGKPMSAVGTHAWLVAGEARVTGFPQASRYNVFASYLDPRG